MRYSFALAALSAGSAVMAGMANELSDGQVQEQVSATSAPTPVAEATAFSTVDVILTSCAPTVKNCPAHKSPSVVPVPFVSVPSPIEAATSATPSVGPPVLASPSPSTPLVIPAQAGSTGSPSAPAPVIPAGAPSAPAGSAPPAPLAAGASSPAIPGEAAATCSPVTVYLTVTATPTPAAAGSTGSPSSGSGSPSNGESGAAGSAAPSGKLPPTPGSSVSVPVGGAAGAAAASGIAAASGVAAASTGA